MREIKFRVWDKEEKEMHSWEDLIPSVDLGYLLSNETEEYDEYEIQQYTGLKDKNGVEVYESDIVEQEFTELGSTEGIFNNPPDDMTSFIGEIKMYEGAWWIDSGSWAIPLFSELSPNEVLGNRYENPELLKEEPTC